MTAKCASMWSRIFFVSAAALCLFAGAVPAQAQCELAKLLAADGDDQDYFGAAVAISGNMAVVGAPQAYGGGSASGAAYVYRFDGMTWSFDARLVPADSTAAQFFGYAVAIDADAIIVGAWGDGSHGTWSGAAYIFRHNGASWLEQAKLTASDAAEGDRFGYSVAIDGARAIVGAVWDDDNYLSNSGSAYVFRRTGDAWVQEAKLLADDGGIGDELGQAVALDGEFAIVGSSLHQGHKGAAYVFRRHDEAWHPDQKLTASDGVGAAQFGFSVAIGDAIAVIGASEDGELGARAGAAYVFRCTDFTWEEESKLLASDGTTEDEFGYFVSTDNQTILVGARWDDPYGYHSGSAYIYGLDGDNWTEHAKLVAPDGASEDKFGFAVALDGGIAVIGAFADDDNGSDSGSAYVFDIAGPDCNENGICDWIDIAEGTSEDVNENGIPDECEDLCPADIFEDGVVNTVDLLILLANWGPCPPEEPCPGDIDESGAVDVADLLALLAAWGPCP